MSIEAWLLLALCILDVAHMVVQRRQNKRQRKPRAAAQAPTAPQTKQSEKLKPKAVTERDIVGRERPGSGWV